MNSTQTGIPAVGIDDLSVYLPKLFLPIETLAAARKLDYAKLSKGLGLYNMAVPDVHEDAATMGASAVLQLLRRNQLNPRQIGRIYLGTESALDGAKPTATYILEMLRNAVREEFGADCFDHCDVIDLTFACIGGVDALHNTLDWVRANPDQIGIIVTADLAKYELCSGGEYTQGAGAVALLVKQDPRLLVIPNVWGVATKGVHDFFKPKRPVSKKQLVEEVLQLAQVEQLDARTLLQKLPDSLEVNGILDDNDHELVLRKDTPVFDGPYSNECYQQRMTNAFAHFRKQAEQLGTLSENESILERWERIVFHLPYALHGRRMFPEVFRLEAIRNGAWEGILAEAGLQDPGADASEGIFSEFLRLLSKTTAYRNFANKQMGGAEWASGQAGNLYACSVFLALAGILEKALEDEELPQQSCFGFIGYGSGSKSKVFEGVLQPNWKLVAKGIGLQQQLSNRVELDYPTYEALHRGALQKSVRQPENEFALKEIVATGTKLGARYYTWA